MQPTHQELWLSFAGDCTLGSEQDRQTSSGGFLSVVDDHICISALPFASRLPELQAAKVGSVVNMCFARALVFSERNPELQM